ncbi:MULTISPECIES: GyrI-like domain-containing protein [Microbacterium]|uniref:GyrI-like domain-containing protein n=1 Tax=Microbacterium TaxID=33882 RepID=UPI000D64C88F|nr:MULTISPECIES: GyrI-like domain-containing protein [Microbacterium]
METLDGPRIERREERSTLGIRRRAPFRGMLAERDRMLADLIARLADHGLEPDGPFFLRLHSVDMAGEMDIEVGVFAAAPGGAVVAPGTIPAGEYAVLVYRNHSLRANRLLQEWVRDSGREFDVDSAPTGDLWAARVEAYLTDPRTEPRKTRWVTELAFLLR